MSHEDGNAVSGTRLVCCKIESSQVKTFRNKKVRFLQQCYTCIAGISYLLHDR